MPGDKDLMDVVVTTMGSISILFANETSWCSPSIRCSLNSTKPSAQDIRELSLVEKGNVKRCSSPPSVIFVIESRICSNLAFHTARSCDLCSSLFSFRLVFWLFRGLVVTGSWEEKNESMHLAYSSFCLAISFSISLSFSSFSLRIFIIVEYASLESFSGRS